MSKPLAFKVDGRWYEIPDHKSPLGKGYWATVYAGFCTATHRRVAIKVLHSARRMEPGRNLENEAAVLARLSKSPNKNVIRGVAYSPDCIITELVNGFEADEYLDRSSPGSSRILRALEVAAQTCDGLAAIHAAGIVHRDVKPNNLLVGHAWDGKPIVKIIDFGCACVTDYSEGQFVRGTPSYMSPEQIEGYALKGSSDVYSLGSTLYELLIEESLFDTRKPELVRQRMLTYKIDDDSRLARIHPRVVGLLRQMLTYIPGERPSAEALGQEIRHIMRELPP